jgi:hypothetical protein
MHDGLLGRSTSWAGCVAYPSSVMIAGFLLPRSGLTTQGSGSVKGFQGF